MIDTSRVLAGIVIGNISVVALLAIRICFYRREDRNGVNVALSDEDCVRYAGKHVMTDGYGGPVVASGETIEEMYEEVSQLDGDRLGHFVYVYIPRENDILIGGRYHSIE